MLITLAILVALSGILAICGISVREQLAILFTCVAIVATSAYLLVVITASLAVPLAVVILLYYLIKHVP